MAENHYQLLKCIRILNHYITQAPHCETWGVWDGQCGPTTYVPLLPNITLTHTQELIIENNIIPSLYYKLLIMW